MDTAFKINALALDASEQHLFLGSQSGELICVDCDSLSEISRVQSNVGDIYASAAHPNLPLAATMGMDFNLSLWDMIRPDKPTLVARFNLRSVRPWNDLGLIATLASQSQALCFHPKSARIATRSGN